MNEIEQKRVVLEKLKKDEVNIDNNILCLQKEFEQLTNDEDFKKYGYITQNDLKNLVNNDNMNIIAIKAPVGTCIEVPDPRLIEEVYQKTKDVSLLKNIIILRI